MGDNFIWRPHRKPPAPAAVGTWIQRSLGALLVQQNQELQKQHQQKQQSAFSFLGRSAGAGRNPLVLASHVPDEGQPGWQDEDQDALGDAWLLGAAQRTQPATHQQQQQQQAPHGHRDQHHVAAGPHGCVPQPRAAAMSAACDLLQPTDGEGSPDGVQDGATSAFRRPPDAALALAAAGSSSPRSQQQRAAPAPSAARHQQQQHHRPGSHNHRHPDPCQPGDRALPQPRPMMGTGGRSGRGLSVGCRDNDEFDPDLLMGLDGDGEEHAAPGKLEMGPYAYGVPSGSKLSPADPYGGGGRPQRPSPHDSKVRPADPHRTQQQGVGQSSGAQTGTSHPLRQDTSRRSDVGSVGGGRVCGGTRAAGGGGARGAGLAAAPGLDQGLTQGQCKEEPRASSHQHQHQQLLRQHIEGGTPNQDPGRQQPWWDDLDDLLGSLGTGAQGPNAGIQTLAGGRRPAGSGGGGGVGVCGGGGGGAKRQAMLTVDGRCVLPPTPAPGEAWRPAAMPSHALCPGQGVPAGAGTAPGPSNGGSSTGAGVGPKTQITLPYPALGPRGSGKGGALPAGAPKVGRAEGAAAGKRSRAGSQGADAGGTDAGPAPAARSGVPRGTAAEAEVAAAVKRPRHMSGGAAGGLFATANALSDPAIAGWAGPGGTSTAAVAAAAREADAGAGKGGSKRKAAGTGAAGGGGAALLSALLPLGEELNPGGEHMARATLACDPQGAAALRSELRSAGAVLLGVLVAAREGPVVQYLSTMQGLAKPQRDALLKARRTLAKAGTAAAPLLAEAAAAAGPRDLAAEPPAGSLSPPLQPSPFQAAAAAAGCYPGAGVLATEHAESVVAFCAMCLPAVASAEQPQQGRQTGAQDRQGHKQHQAHTWESALAWTHSSAPLYLLPTAPQAWEGMARQQAAGAKGGGGSGAGAGAAAGGCSPLAPLLALLGEMLEGGPGFCPVLCCGSKTVMREALSLGWQPPLPRRLRLLDPVVLAWMEQPQLAQRDEKEIEAYTLEQLCPRYGINMSSPAGAGAGGQGQAAAGAAAAACGPLLRVRRGLVAGAALFEVVQRRVAGWLDPRAVQLEMQVCCVLARMEAVGVAVAVGDLARAAAAVRRRMERLGAAASALLGGRAINLGSSQQLAAVLYDELKLPHPEGIGKDRGRSQHTHVTTDEAALRQLQKLHPLPGLVLEYRTMQNVLSKWLEPEWLQPLLARTQAAAALGASGSTSATARAAAGPPPPRLCCSWNQTATATGRLSSSSPNLQAVTKYVVDVEVEDGGQGGNDPQGGPQLRIVSRNAFVAPPGRLLVSADYSQVELRLLAHMSGDLRLRELLRRAGAAGDAFRLIAASWLRPGAAPTDVTSTEREQAKRVVYGIIYGMTPAGLAQALAGHGVSYERACALRASFLHHFAGVQAFIASTQTHARRSGHVSTLLGRRRPLAGLVSADARVRAEAERKVVNSIVQGSAADLMKMAMCAWAELCHPDTAQQLAERLRQQHADGQRAHAGPHQPHGADGIDPLTAAAATAAAAAAAAAGPTGVTVGAPGGAELLGQIHDELLFECPATRGSVAALCGSVRHVMCGVAALDVPLVVKVAAGARWGDLQDLSEAEAEAAQLDWLPP